MKKGHNTNTLHPHLLCFWIKGTFKEGVILRTRKKTNKSEEQNETKKPKDTEDDEDIKLYKYFIKKMKRYRQVLNLRGLQLKVILRIFK
jgi:hypothetical protein